MEKQIQHHSPLLGVLLLLFLTSLFPLLRTVFLYVLKAVLQLVKHVEVFGKRAD